MEETFPVDTYIYDPTTGTLAYGGLDEPLYHTTLETLTYGKYYIANGAIVNKELGIVEGNIPTTRPSTFTYNPTQGNITVIKETPLSALNSRTDANFGDAIGGSYNIIMPNGDERSIGVPISGILTEGTRIATYTDAEGGTHWNEVAAQSVEGRTTWPDLEGPWRWATPEESAQFLTVGYLMKHYADILNQILFQSEESELTEPLDTWTDAINYILQWGFDDIHAFKAMVIGF